MRYKKNSGTEWTSPFLSVENVSKRFRVHSNRPVTFKEYAIRRLKGRHERSRSLWALRDVSLSVEHGQALGIIGHNGAGKSTLLRLICGLGRPTKGAIHRRGNFGSLLELGSGFDPELSGRENLMTGGILSGMTKRQVKAKEDEIIVFSELEDFIDQPVRTYSSGMYVRLAFSSAIHFDPDFLIVDEILAVGDSRFQRKCLDWMSLFRKAGKSLVLVSHDLEQVRFLCDEVLVLEEGRMIMQGDPEKAISCYHDLMRQRTERRSARVSGVLAGASLTPEQGSRLGTQEATLQALRLYDRDGNPVDCISHGDGLTIEIEYGLAASVPDMAITLGIYNEANVKCFETAIPSAKEAFGALNKAGRLRCHFPDVPLLGGRYFINAGLYPTNWDYVYDYHWQMHVLHVEAASGKMSGASGVVFMNPSWSVLE